MKWFSFWNNKAPKNFLGIDIGTSSIKVVELNSKQEKLSLENYGEIKTTSLQKAPFRVIEKNGLLLSNQEVSKAISIILKTAGIKTKEVNFSIPDFSSFFISFELPLMSERELPQAIKYEARSYIPLPLSEVTLDWSIIEGKNNGKSKESLKVLVAAIPNEIISRYQEIAVLTGLEMIALEAEAFALSRALAGDKKEIIGIIDIGVRSTTVNILEKGILKLSYSINLSGNELTEAIVSSLDVEYEKAENLKQELGLINEEIDKENLKKILIPLVDSILNEIKKVLQSFYEQEGKEVEKIILAGGTAFLPGLKEYFFDKLKKETEIANSFQKISYPANLEEVLKEMRPTYAIPIGLAMKGLE